MLSFILSFFRNPVQSLFIEMIEEDVSRQSLGLTNAGVVADSDLVRAGLAGNVGSMCSVIELYALDNTEYPTNWRARHIIRATGSSVSF